MFKILIVEDEEKIRVELQNLLNRYGYEAMVLDDFHEVDHQILQIQPHLVLLDINLPEMDGYMICRSIRQQSSIPVLMVTSRSSDLDELMSMSLGADDFITKPYNVQILLAHIQAVLKRAYPQDQGRLLEVNGVTLDLSKGCVMHEHQSVELTKNEIRILWLLMRKQGTIVSRDEIMTDLWQSEEFVDDNTLTVNINRLRRKLESIGVSHDYLSTKRGLGYRI